MTIEEWSDGHGSASPVGVFDANRFGLHDVHGNVFEWCDDTYGEGPLERQESVARTYRGGAWLWPALIARVTHRVVVSPGYVDPVLGVRPARSLDGPAAGEVTPDSGIVEPDLESGTASLEEVLDEIESKVRNLGPILVEYTFGSDDRDDENIRIRCHLDLDRGLMYAGRPGPRRTEWQMRVTTAPWTVISLGTDGQVPTLLEAEREIRRVLEVLCDQSAQIDRALGRPSEYETADQMLHDLASLLEIDAAVEERKVNFMVQINFYPAGGDRQVGVASWVNAIREWGVPPVRTARGWRFTKPDGTKTIEVGAEHGLPTRIDVAVPGGDRTGFLELTGFESDHPEPVAEIPRSPARGLLPLQQLAMLLTIHAVGHVQRIVRGLPRPVPDEVIQSLEILLRQNVRAVEEVIEEHFVRMLVLNYLQSRVAADSSLEAVEADLDAEIARFRPQARENMRRSRFGIDTLLNQFRALLYPIEDEVWFTALLDGAFSGSDRAEEGEDVGLDSQEWLKVIFEEELRRAATFGR